MSLSREHFISISPADFFYRNRDLAGFTNPARALYTAVREFVENSLDACETHQYLPNVYVRLLQVEETEGGAGIYKLKVEDNGPGLPPDRIPEAFGKVLFGSKFSLRQTRGKFGLGGTMAVLYGQITANKSTTVISSSGGVKIHKFELQIDILRNKPKVILHEEFPNPSKWHGLSVETYLEGDHYKAMPRIISYFKQTAIANPHANISFIDPSGRFYVFKRVTNQPPPPPADILPHPHGMDVESLQRLISATKCKDMLSFMIEHFHRVGNIIARKFLEFAGIPFDTSPKNLGREDLVKLVQAMKSFKKFKNPDSSCLSTLSKEMIVAGIRREFDPEFIAVSMRKPSAYSGFPFIVNVALAYGENVPKVSGGLLYRFANRIPLLFDEASDVAWKVMHTMVDWKKYGVSLEEDPIAVFVYLSSVKIPFKTVGKEFIADRPEIESEILNGIRDVGRQLRIYLSKKRLIEQEKKRIDVYSKYLLKIAQFSTELAEKEEVPDIEQILKGVRRFGKEA